MCKTSSMMWTVPAMPMLAMMKMAGMTGAPRGAEPCPTGCRSRDSGEDTAQRGRDKLPSIVETARSAGSFSTLVDLLRRADLAEVLEAPGPFTVFAPTDDAFRKLPRKALAELANDPARLAAVLKNHVVRGQLSAGDLAGVDRLRTLAGQSVGIDTTMGVRVASSYVIQPDIRCANGTVHAIDAVILLD